MAADAGSARPNSVELQSRRRSAYLWLAVLFIVAAWVLIPLGKPRRNGEMVDSTNRAAGMLHADEIPSPGSPYPFPPGMEHLELMKQSDAEVEAKSAGCVACHQGIGDPHGKRTVRLGCTDCHGGDASATDKDRAHIHPRHPDAWLTSANPVRSYTLLNHESPDFIRFVNPGDLRVAHISCGTSGCHPREVLQNRKSMMTHGCMLWGAALYNNGSVPFKRSRYGEAYSMHGVPLRLQTYPPPSQEEMEKRGVVPFLDPLLRFEVSQPGNILRIFERGAKLRPELGIPDRKEEPGRPLGTRLGLRGLGTDNRTDPVFIGLQKTRLLDPTLNFLGTNDQPGDYRSSGCTACHIVYANDRSPIHSSTRYAKFGNQGMSFSADPMIPKNESGHPIEHRFAPGNSIPSSQCMVCHIHPGTTVMNSYLGYMWWDLETDGELMYPPSPRKPTAEEVVQASFRNPEESSLRGLWSDPEFLANLTDLNTQTKKTIFADFHGHGWAFRAVFKKNRHGQYLDHEGNVIEEPTNAAFNEAVRLPADIHKLYAECERQASPVHPPIDDLAKERDGLPVHLLDIHMQKGMHCIDCHFVQDMHGNTRLQMEVRAAVEIQCIDCHGTSSQYATLRTSGPASYTSDPEGKGRGRDLLAMRTPSGKPRFERRGDAIVQRSMVEPDLMWDVVQTKDTIDPKHPQFNAKSALAKTVRFEPHEGRDVLAWGKLPENPEASCAHSHSKMSCIACHSSWNPTCYGCHLPQKANMKTPQLHNEGDVTRNWTAYNWQTLRDDVYMIAKDGDVTGNRIGPVRSACAIHVGSYNNNRESIYVQQQTISAEGFSGIAFSTNVPHTVRGGPRTDEHGLALNPAAYQPGHSETKSCTDCHLSVDENNNAIMAQLLMQGTNYLNFVGRYCWVAGAEHGLAGVIVTEREEPQAVIGSHLHRLAFPDRYSKHVEHHGELHSYHEHPGKDIGDNIVFPFRGTNVLNLQHRGEYLYAACGKAGLKVFDIAFIDHKGFAERIVSTPVSPFGQKFFINTKYATAVASPATTAVDPTRTHLEENREGRPHPLYAYLYVTDKYEGLILVGAGTLLDGKPDNNFLKRALTYNPRGLLNGARAITIVGNYAYICADAGLVVVCLDDPMKPRVTSIVGSGVLHHPKAVAVQFRYAFVCDDDGLKVLDVTDLARPKPASSLALPDAKSVYVARTYAYIAGGEHGLIIVNVENPLAPAIDQIFTAGGCINDLHDVKLGVTYTSQFAYLADGKNGLRVVQLTSPETPGYEGFAAPPFPTLIATFRLPNNGHALAIAKGVDRDRAVDESGNQLSVFGRVGAGPLNLEEQRRLYLKNGLPYKLSDDPRHPVYHQHPTNPKLPGVPSE